MTAEPDGRRYTVAVISSTGTRLKGFIFANDAGRQEYFLHRSVCKPMQLFDELRDGDLVSFSVASAPKGLRGHDVRRATDDEQESYLAAARAYSEQVEETRGNSAAFGEVATRVAEVEGAGSDRAGRRR